MTDIAVTGTLVVAGANAKISHGIAGVTITAGQLVYLDSTTGKYGLADTDSATAGVRSAIGMALNGAALNQPVSVQCEGLVTPGATLTQGVFYYLSGTPGGFCPVADVAAGDYPLIVGQAISASVLSLKVQYGAVVL